MDPIAVLSTLITGLTLAIVAMWKVQRASEVRLTRRADACEEDRAAIRHTLTQHGQVIAIFRACPAKDCPAMEGIERAREAFSLHIEVTPSPFKQRQP